MDGLSMVLDSVKILYIQMNSFDLNKIIGLLQCFPCLEKLYIKATGRGKKVITNWWIRKHRDFLTSHEIRLKTITLERYVANRANTRFVTFFLLNARLLLSIRLKFISSMVLTDGYVEEQKKEFQVGKRASERAGLLFTTYCGHNPVNFTTQDVHSMDLTDPFDCDCRKQCWS
ncbi:hypothetical protein VPH35_059791 [Triticum aestivum]